MEMTGLKIKWFSLSVVACLVAIVSCAYPDLWWLWIGIGMAASPVYASVGHNGTIILNNASSTNVSASIITGVAAGTRIKEIRVGSGPTTAPGAFILTLLYDDGSNQVVLEELTLTNTANLLQGVFKYDNLILPGTGHSIKAVMRTAITSGGTITIAVLGEDLT